MNALKNLFQIGIIYLYVFLCVICTAVLVTAHHPAEGHKQKIATVVHAAAKVVPAPPATPPTKPKAAHKKHVKHVHRGFTSDPRDVIATNELDAVIKDVNDAMENYPTLCGEFVQPVLDDLLKISDEHVADKEFHADFNQLETDRQSLLEAEQAHDSSYQL